MTITITPSAPTSRVGLGLPLTLQSTFIGPLPTGTRWLIGVYVTSVSNANFVWGESFGAGSVGPTAYYLGLSSSGLVQTPIQFPAEGGAVIVDASLFSTSELDHGTLTTTWSIANGSWWREYLYFNTLSFLVPSASSVQAILNAVRTRYTNP